ADRTGRGARDRHGDARPGYGSEEADEWERGASGVRPGRRSDGGEAGLGHGASRNSLSVWRAQPRAAAAAPARGPRKLADDPRICSLRNHLRQVAARTGEEIRV